MTQDRTQHDRNAHDDMTRHDVVLTMRGSAVPARATVEEAARLLGVSVDAIRKRIERGTLESEKVSGTRYVFLDHVSTVGHDTNMSSHDLDMTHRNPGQDDDRTRHDNDMTDLLASMQDQIDTLKQELEDRKEEARRKDHLLAAALERIPAIEAPPDTPNPNGSPEPRGAVLKDEEPKDGNGVPDAEDGQQKGFWRRFFGL